MSLLVGDAGTVYLIHTQLSPVEFLIDASVVIEINIVRHFAELDLPGLPGPVGLLEYPSLLVLKAQGLLLVNHLILVIICP